MVLTQILFDNKLIQTSIGVWTLIFFMLLLTVSLLTLQSFCAWQFPRLYWPVLLSAAQRGIMCFLLHTNTLLTTGPRKQCWYCSLDVSLSVMVDTAGRRSGSTPVPLYHVRGRSTLRFILKSRTYRCENLESYWDFSCYYSASPAE